MNSCLICGEKNLVYRPYGPTFPVLPKEARIQICTTCGLGMVTPLPDIAAVEAYYRVDQYQQWHSSEKLLQMESLPHSRALSQYDFLASYFHFRSVRTVLDFGAGSAPTLRTIKIRHPHIITSVVELSKSLRELLTNCDEIDNVYETLPNDLNRYDVIIVSGTLEHLVDPFIAMRKFRHLLTKGGYLFIEVPNCPFPLYYDIKTGCAPHLFFFTQESFTHMAPQLDLKLMYAGVMGVGIKEWSEIKNRLDIIIRTGFCYASNKTGIFLRALLKKERD